MIIFQILSPVQIRSLAALHYIDNMIYSNCLLCQANLLIYVNIKPENATL